MWIRCLTALCFPLAPLVLEAQAAESPVRGELRVDVITARATALQGGLGIGIRTGYNVRLHIAGAGGVAWKDGVRESSARGDLTLRLLLDPYAETRAGFSIGGGLSVLYDGFEKTRPVGVVVLGLEGPPRSAVVWSLEGALGGGLRVGLVMRRRARRYR